MANITYIRIGDEVYGLHDDNALTSNSNLNASKVVGTLPANTYTNTTYENKAAVEGGTDVSLVTTGDKYRWNNTSGGGVSDVEVNGSSVVSGGVAEITVPTKTSDLTNDSNFQNATQVDTAINSRIASVYKAKGSIAFASLPALTSSNEGFVYDINESFTTTSDFVEGAGATYPAGTNVVIIDIGNGIYKYDVLAGVIDLSGKQDKLISGFNIKKINNQSILGSGNLTIDTGLQNLVDGDSTGSVRGIGTGSESASYNLGDYALAEGYFTFASGNYSHAEGERCFAEGRGSHAEGINTSVTGVASHSMGSGTLASSNNQIALGTCNVPDEDDLYAVIVGNGDSVSTPSNALTVDWQGNVDIAYGAKYKINGTALSASDVGAQPTLVSGTNIKTINNQSLLGSGNLTIGGNVDDVTVDGTSVVTNKIAAIDLSGKQETLVSGTNIKTINNQSLLGSGNISIQSGSDQIFIATPDVTSYAELDEAISNGQLICIVTSTGEILPCSCGYVNVPTNPPIFLSYQEVASTRLSRYTISTDNDWSLGTTDLQSKLVSGTNIKTINNQSVLGSGNIDVSYDLTATDDGAGTVTLSLNS